VDDTDIVKRVQRGDSESFSLLVEKYHRQLLSFIYRLTGDATLVEDIGQDVFLSVYKSIRKFDLSRNTPFSAWLFITARNRCVSELRRRRRPDASADGGESASGEESPEGAAINNERSAAVRASLDGLAEPYRSTILRSLDGMLLKEIAHEDGISVGTVKSRISRARERMKSLLHEYLPGGEEP